MNEQEIEKLAESLCSKAHRSPHVQTQLDKNWGQWAAVARHVAQLLHSERVKAIRECAIALESERRYWHDNGHQEARDATYNAIKILCEHANQLEQDGK